MNQAKTTHYEKNCNLYCSHIATDSFRVLPKRRNEGDCRDRVQLTSANLTLVIGDTKKLDASVEPSNATNKTVLWSSSNATVAMVGRDGLVAALKEVTLETGAKIMVPLFIETGEIITVNTTDRSYGQRVK